jgi:hypothetical protein
MWINCDINRLGYPEAVETVKNSCYMDTCCYSRETEEQAAVVTRMKRARSDFVEPAFEDGKCPTDIEFT